ncbi:hypothetical protein VNO77_33754 [Canavalia gladiata]|uniref:Uncharacterized protein n=1 Tax=Canavalia gladiata TaxID=3824 RepID=A0AAN9KFH1_CANGL
MPKLLVFDPDLLKSARKDIKELLKKDTKFCHPILICKCIGTSSSNQDLFFQLDGATSVEESRGPKFLLKYGRMDVFGPKQCPEE